MSNYVVANALRDYLRLKDDLNAILELKEEAFRVFSKSIAGVPINKVMSVFNDSWQRLFDWKSREEHHFGFLDMQDYNEVEIAFNRLANANINRTEFADLLAPSRSAVEKHIAELKKTLETKRNELLQLYNECEAFNTSNLAFIFKEPAVRDLFMNFLES